MAEGASRIDHVIDHHAVLAVNLANDIHDLRLVGFVAAFVDDDKISIAKPLRQGAASHYADYVGRYDNHVFVLLLPDITQQQW